MALIKYLQATVLKGADQDQLFITLKHQSVWRHAIAIAAACKHFGISMHVMVDKAAANLSVTQFFTIYCLG